MATRRIYLFMLRIEIQSVLGKLEKNLNGTELTSSGSEKQNTLKMTFCNRHPKLPIWSYPIVILMVQVRLSQIKKTRSNEELQTIFCAETT